MEKLSKESMKMIAVSALSPLIVSAVLFLCYYVFRITQDNKMYIILAYVLGASNMGRSMSGMARKSGKSGIWRANVLPTIIGALSGCAVVGAVQAVFLLIFHMK